PARRARGWAAGDSRLPFKAAIARNPPVGKVMPIPSAFPSLRSDGGYRMPPASQSHPADRQRERDKQGVALAKGFDPQLRSDPAHGRPLWRAGVTAARLRPGQAGKARNSVLFSVPET